MKKSINILCLTIFLCNNFGINLSYATENINSEEVIWIFEPIVKETFENYNKESHNTDNVIIEEENKKLLEVENNEDKEDVIEYIWGDSHIVWNKTKGIITVYTWNFSYGVSIQDKNLWAVNVWETWLYYQYGINYWNPQDSETTDKSIERNDEYTHKWYPYETLFITNSTLRKWNNTSEITTWWWENDNPGNNRWLDISWSTINYRQWPCNEDYHIPSLWERWNLINTRCNTNNCWNWTYKISNDIVGGYYKNWIWTKFYNDLIIPFSQRRRVDWNLYESTRRLMTSTPRRNGWMPVIAIWDNDIYISWDPIYDWLNIRCFKNQYIPFSKKVTYNPNWWSFSWMNINQSKEYTYTADENWIIPIYNIQIPDRISEDLSQQSWWMFDWWYTKNWNNWDRWEEFDPSKQNAEIVYAKWLPFNELKLNIWWQEITIMDRNIWAEGVANWTIIWKWEHEDNSVLWKYFQWWNNYWFNNNWNITNSWTNLIKNPKHRENPWWPNNYYYSNKYITRNSDPMRRDYDNNFNLWWGSEQKNTDNDRKGPCPSWYHIPYYDEWMKIKNLIIKEITNNSNYCTGELNDISKCLLKKLKLPYAGSLNNWTTKVYYWQSTNYRSSKRWDNTDYWIKHGAMWIDIDIWGYGVSWLHSYRTSTFPIRCFKDTTPINNIIIEKNNWEKDITYHFRRRESITSDYKPENPVKKWYCFSWWYEKWTNKEFNFNNEPVTQERIFYAKWNPNHYTIHFSTWDLDDINATYWEGIELPTLTKEWYVFKWWKSGNWTIYNWYIPEWTWATTEDWATVTLTAQWETKSTNNNINSAWWWSTINPTKNNKQTNEQGHNSADTEKETSNTNSEEKAKNDTTNSVEEKIQTISPKSLTRWELAVFSNILLDIIPKLTENKRNINEVCTEYTDYQEFSSKEQKAVSKLCRLAIMWIHEDDKTPLETFWVHNLSTNEEFIKVVNRMTDKYSEEELKDLKSALSSLEENKEENLSFWTVVNIFKKVKNLFE